MSSQQTLTRKKFDSTWQQWTWWQAAGWDSDVQRHL